MIKKITISVILLLTVFGCSSDDSDNDVSNGFKVNGTFYSTESATLASINPYRFTFSNFSNHNLPDAHFGNFAIKAGPNGENTTLSAGTYSTEDGANGITAISDQLPIHFQDNSEDNNFAYSQYWDIDDDFRSGKVIINSVTSDENNQVTFIDIDYRFKWNDVTIIGNYNGSVIDDPTN